jgi:hypothetical protein
VFYSLEEKRAYYKNAITSQKVGECKYKVVGSGGNPISLKTIVPPPIYVTDEVLEAFKKKSYVQNGVLTSSEADTLIEQRHKELLGEQYTALAREGLRDDEIIIGEPLDPTQDRKYAEKLTEGRTGRSTRPYKPRTRRPKA